MNIFDMANVLRAERDAGIALEAEIIERVDAHIRDLQLFKAWVKDSMEPRHMALGSMLGQEPKAPQAPEVEREWPGMFGEPEAEMKDEAKARAAEQ